MIFNNNNASNRDISNEDIQWSEIGDAQDNDSYIDDTDTDNNSGTNIDDIDEFRYNTLATFNNHNTVYEYEYDVHNNSSNQHHVVGYHNDNDFTELVTDFNQDNSRKYN